MFHIWMAEQNKGASPFVSDVEYGDSRTVAVFRHESRTRVVARSDTLKLTVPRVDSGRVTI